LPACFLLLRFSPNFFTPTVLKKPFYTPVRGAPNFFENKKSGEKRATGVGRQFLTLSAGLE
jgi:hypothetical protein